MPPVPNPLIKARLSVNILVRYPGASIVCTVIICARACHTRTRAFVTTERDDVLELRFARCTSAIRTASSHEWSSFGLRKGDTPRCDPPVVNTFRDSRE